MTSSDSDADDEPAPPRGIRRVRIILWLLVLGVRYSTKLRLMAVALLCFLAAAALGFTAFGVSGWWLPGCAVLLLVLGFLFRWWSLRLPYDDDARTKIRSHRRYPPEAPVLRSQILSRADPDYAERVTGRRPESFN